MRWCCIKPLGVSVLVTWDLDFNTQTGTGDEDSSLHKTGIKTDPPSETGTFNEMVDRKKSLIHGHKKDVYLSFCSRLKKANRYRITPLI